MLVRNDCKEPLLAGKVGIFFGAWWSGYTVADATLAGEADWRAYFTPLAEDGNYYAHMPNPTSKYVVASKNCKNPEAAFKIVNYLIANQQQWVADGITSTEMVTSDFILCIMSTIMQMRLKYPLRLWKNILQERLQWMMSISQSINC